MATEQEELKLVVTLVDNASAGLGKLQDQIKELGGGGGAGGNKHIEKLNEGTKALTETLSKMTGSFGEAFKSLGMLRLGFIGGVAGLAAFGYEMAKQIKDLGDYTDKIRNLGQLGKDIGVNPGAIKNISEQLKVFGVSAEQSEAAISKFAQRMAELQRDPRVRMGILQETANTPQAQADMKARIDALNNAVTIEDKLNIARQMYENIRQNARKRGESEERAADEARQGMLKFGYDTELSRAGVLKNLTDDEVKGWAAKQKPPPTTTRNLLGKIGGRLGAHPRCHEEPAVRHRQARWSRCWSDSSQFSDGSSVANRRAAENRESTRAPLKGGEDPGKADSGVSKDRWPGASDSSRGPLKLQKQSYRGTGDVQGTRCCMHVAFITEEQKKSVEEEH